MPTVLRVGPYRFFFYSNERSEPPHVHVEASGKVGKIWLVPVSVANQGRFSKKEMQAIVNLANAHHGTLLGAWHAYFP